ncbi:MAG: hypothetical protein P0Y64_15775 [Candidatus Sphingomonas colombiensis]|nr:hypothetical protein [Sphingomonas sp.]WEK42796.1 MAG: hypothetical protein P0Y64_15775 [Sphingomonas sp.]
MTEQKKKENAVEETLHEIFVDPDSPANHKGTKPPQTIQGKPHDDKS